MSGMTPTFERLIGKFAALPGLGRKSGVRLAFHVLDMTDEQAADFINTFIQARKTVKRCNVCRNLSDTELCNVCSDPVRDNTTICIVEDPRAVEAIEATREYKGLYHILYGVISPSDNIGPEELGFQALFNRLDSSVKEVIIATNPSLQGEATATYLARLMRPLGDFKISRIAYGIPVGGSLAYADNYTLTRALEGRTEL